MSDEVLYEADGRVATITLNRPSQRNAVNPELATALSESMERLEADLEVWGAVLTGAGETFSAGADLKAIAAGRAAELSAGRGGFAGFVAFPRTKRSSPRCAGSPWRAGWSSCSRATSWWPRATRPLGCRR